MFKITKEEFLEEIMAELMSYEEISKQDINDFVGAVNKYFKAKKGEKNRISYRPDSIVIQLKDESELLMKADQYYAAVINNEKEQYFNSFSI